jgi:hypothetical protein
VSAPIAAAEVLDYIDEYAGQDSADEVCDFVQTAARFIREGYDMKTWHDTEEMSHFLLWVTQKRRMAETVK